MLNPVSFMRHAHVRKLLHVIFPLLFVVVAFPVWPNTASAAGEPSVRQTLFYDAPTDGKSEQTVADLAEMVIFTRGKFLSYVPSLRSKGFNGLELQYFMSNEVTAAGYYANSSAWCDSAYKPTMDQVAVNTGDFCRSIHPNESWFLHNGQGKRLANRRGNGDYQYEMNPASSGWRTFVRQRLLTDLYGSSSQAKVGADGFMLDNLALRIYKLQNQIDNSDGTVREYSSDAAYRSAISGYLSFMREKLPNTPIWANMIDDWSVSASDYLATTSHLSGIMNEAWGLFYSSQPIKTEYWQTSLQVTEAAVARGQGILAVVQGDQTNYQRQQFGLASYLLISDSDQTFFRYAKASAYRSWWQYDNYKVSLGEPKGKRYQTSSGWRRDFACGYVSVDLAAKTGKIVQTTCSTTSTDSSTPSPTTSRIAIPGLIEAENYKNGGQNVGYYDTTSGNTGGAYRSDDVDIAPCSDGSGCHNIGWIKGGEWLAYDVSVSTTGNYAFSARVSTVYSSKKFHIEVDGKNVTGSITVPNTGGWSAWTNVSSPVVSLTSGNHTIRVVAETDSFNLNSINVIRK